MTYSLFSFLRPPVANADSYSGLVTEDSTAPVLLDVLANDSAGASLWSIDDATGGFWSLLGLVCRDTPGVSERSALGARIAITSDGRVSYELTATLRAALQPLGAGQSVWDSFTYAMRGPNGLFNIATVRVELHGLDEGASLTATPTGAVTEDGVLTATGTITVTDPDAGQSQAAADSGASALGSWAVTAGAWSYTANNAALQHLGAGVAVTDSFTVRSLDGSLSQLVTVTLTGVNDAAAIAGDTSGAITEDATLLASGQLTVSDADDGEAQAQPASGTTGYGAWSVLADGTWTYTANNAALQSLRAAETATDSFAVASADGTASTTVTVTLTGTNDTAAIAGTLSAALGEDDAAPATGTVTVTDADAGESAAQAAAGTTARGSYTVDAAGTWTYTLDTAAAQALRDGETATDSFTITSLDGTASAVVQVAIAGSNDAASLSGDTSGAITEDTTLLATGQLTVSDADTGEAQLQPASGTTAYGAWSVLADGTWTYTADNAALQSLRAAETATDSFAVASADGTASTTITVTLTGANDPAALAGTLSAALGEDDALPATGTVTVTDADAGESATQAETGTTALGSYTIDGAGLWSYALNTAAAQHLAAGTTATDSFTLRSLDGTATAQVQLTIAGTNDPASIAGTLADSVIEDESLTATGTVTVSDPDDGEAQAQPATGTTAYGSYAVQANGAWTWQLDNAAAQSLGKGQAAFDSFAITSADGTATETVTLTILGRNDAAVIGGTTTGAVQEDGTLKTTGALTITDIDAGQAIFQPQINTQGLYGKFALGLDGAWSYTLDNTAAAVQDLVGGEVVQDSFSAKALDGTTQTVTIAVTGDDDVPGDIGGPADIGFLITQAGNSTNPLGRFTATDPDGDLLTWSLTQSGKGGFTLNAATGELSGGLEGSSQLTISAADDATHVKTETYQVWIGTNGNDTSFILSTDNNIVFGQNGQDVIAGSDGTDYLAGSAGADRLLGLKGADFLYGGSGGFDADEFRYRFTTDSNAQDGIDTVLDFNAAADDLTFHTALGLGSVVGDVTGLGGGAAVLAGQVGWAQAGADTTVFANTGGTLMEILLKGVNAGTLSAGNINTAGSF